MHGQESEPNPERARRFVPVAMSKPVLASALGIDGGAVFQILAVENLGLSPTAVGIAFGLGLLSLPFQLWAARMPLRFARRNVQIFFLLAALQSGLLAWLLAVGATGGLAATALAVTVTAEIAISVLFVTGWQPLLSTRIGTRDRQRVNAGWAAAGRGLLAGFLIVFSAFEGVGRPLLLAGLALVAVGVAANFGRVAAPDPRVPSSLESPTERRPPHLPPVMWWILGSFMALHLGALPLWLVYLSAAMWPSADLGAIGAIQTVAVFAALLAWRPTKGALGARAMLGVLLVMAGSIALIVVGESAEGIGEQVGVVLITVAMTFGMTYAGLALLEMAHRLVGRQQDVVRVLTIIDVVDSSALQLGLFIGGFLVTWSVQTSASTPYVAFVVAMSALALAAVWRTVRLTSKHTAGG